MQTQRQKMTPEQARSFERTSIGNAVTVKTLLECGCEPYEDVFTFRRWLAQGFAVQKGQKAIRLPLVKVTERENAETGEIERRRILGSSAVFCRCQVAPVKSAAPAAMDLPDDDRMDVFCVNCTRNGDGTIRHCREHSFTFGGFINNPVNP